MYFVIEIKVNIYSLIIIESSICAVGVLPEGIIPSRKRLINVKMTLCVEEVLSAGICPGFVYSSVRRVSATYSGGYFSCIQLVFAY